MFSWNQKINVLHVKTSVLSASSPSIKKHSWEQQSQPVLRSSTVVGSTAKNLTTGSLMPKLNCAHEADTAIFTIYSVLCSEGYSEAVILDTEDPGN